MSTYPDYAWDEPSDLTPSLLRYPCCGAYWEDGCQCDDGILGTGPGSARITDESDDYVDPRENECPDCGFDLSACNCRWDSLTGQVIVGGYTNGDRAEDTEADIVRPSDAAFYTDENGG